MRCGCQGTPWIVSRELGSETSRQGPRIMGVSVSPHGETGRLDMTHGRPHMKLVLAVNLTIVLVGRRPGLGLEVGIKVNSPRHPVTLFGREFCDLGLTS